MIHLVSWIMWVLSFVQWSFEVVWWCIYSQIRLKNAQKLYKRWLSQLLLSVTLCRHQPTHRRIHTTIVTTYLSTRKINRLLQATAPPVNTSVSWHTSSLVYMCPHNWWFLICGQTLCRWQHQTIPVIKNWWFYIPNNISKLNLMTLPIGKNVRQPMQNRQT